MANSYTEHYQLCQWAGSDNFLRGEFNQDNQKIDGALAALAGQLAASNTRLARLESQLPAIYGNLYNLSLGQCYDGKDTSYKKMLFLDGMKDTSRISATAPGVWYDPVLKRPRIYTAGAQSVTSPFVCTVGDTGSPGSDGNKCEWLGSNSNYTTKQLEFTPTGFGKLQSVTLRLAKYATTTANTTVRVQVLDGSTVLATSQNVTVTSNAFADFAFTFGSGLSLQPRPYILQIENVSKTYYLRVSYTTAGSAKIAVSYNFSPLNYSTGSFTSVQTDLGQDYVGALAWVRHVGGTVGLAVKAGNGGFVALERVASRTSATLQGQSCTESAFRLTAPPAAPNRLMTAQVTLNAGNGSCAVCDYGIAFF